MNYHTLPRRIASITAAASLTGALLVSGVASADGLHAKLADSTTVNSTTGTSTGSTTDTAGTQQQRLQNIITKGNEEIDRRLVTLGTLTSKINAATKLTSTDKATLSNEVTTTTQGLTGLKAHLDADTTVAAAHTDAMSIYTEYRVYYLVVPKVSFIKVADDQQSIQSNLTTLAGKLQTRINAAQKAGKDVTTLQNELKNMENSTAAAHAISSDIENSVINLQPSDYNSNHAILSGDNVQLKNAHNDDQAAFTDAKEIITSLKSM